LWPVTDVMLKTLVWTTSVICTITFNWYSNFAWWLRFVHKPKHVAIKLCNSIT
jgi:hypothetical protein